MKKFLLLFAICFISFIFLTYRITEVPPGINGDEAAIGYNAALLARSSHDESGKYLPLFVAPKTTDMKQPVYVYFMTTLFKIFEPSLYLLRTTSVSYIIFSIIILYFLCKDYFGTRFFLISWLIFLTTPIVLLLSHWGAENVAPLPFILLWLWMMAKYEIKSKRIYLLIAGSALGIFLFTYYAARAISPVLVVITFTYMFFVLKKNFKKAIGNLIYFVVGLSPFVMILYISKFYYPGAIFGYYRPDTHVTLYIFLYRYLSIFDPSFLFFKGDTTIYHSTGFYGMLLLPTFPFFLLGAYKILRSKSYLLKLILAVFVFGPLLFGLVQDIHRASRLLSLTPFYVLISAYGIKELLSVGKMKLRLVIILLTLTLFMVSYYNFAKDYWFVYPKRVAQDFAPSTDVLYEKMKAGVGSDYRYYSSIQFFKETKIWE